MDRAMEWRIECPNCGTFNYVGPEPVLCPKCQSTEIDTTDRRAEIRYWLGNSLPGG